MAQITDTVEAVEALVDKHGLQHVLTALELMCGEKAAHLRANWQDRASARTWLKAGSAIYKAACNTNVEAVS